MKKLAFIPLLILAMSCSSIKVAYDYDKQTDFSKFKTYAFSPETLTLPVDDINRGRIISAVETELAAKGFTKSETPDAIVDILIKGKQVQTATATNTGGGPWRYGYGGGFSSTYVSYDSYVEGTMFITLIDKSTEKIVWQGTGTKTIDESASAEKREANINYSVKQIMTNYPPVKK